MMYRLACCLGLAAGPAACSVLLDFEECEVDEQCEAGGQCTAGRCRAAEAQTIEVTAPITEDTTWEAPNTYVLDAVVYVEPGATLTIRSGTQIRGREGSALIVESGATLIARGTEFDPIVFTSDKPERSRVPGDWGGVALLGRAPVNAAGAVLEGVAEVDRVGFGGADATWSCGVLEYVRIEFAGFAIEQDAELNGLTLAGCGSGTLVSHVQVHYGLDDGIEVFGGAVNLRNIVVTRAQDDSIDWDLGWVGAAQFVVAQQDPEGDNGFEGSNNGDDADALPRSAPRFYNVTLVGSGSTGSQRAMTLKEGTAGTMQNVVMIGHPLEGIDIKDAATVARLQAGELVVSNAMMFDIGPDGATYFPSVEDETEVMMGDERDDDEGFDEAAFFAAVSTVVLGVDPGLPAPFDLELPGFVPLGDAPLQAGGAPGGTPFDGFDELAAYAGAFEPATAAPWTANWTRFPRD